MLVFIRGLLKNKALSQRRGSRKIRLIEGHKKGESLRIHLLHICSK